jgi:glycoprotein-N-acetylgalactosamine 3-beta-galactosyltransferase
MKRFFNKKKIFLVIIFVSALTVFEIILLHNFTYFDLKSVLKLNEAKPKILCLVITTPKYLDTRADTVYEAWAKKCLSVKFITTIPNKNSSILYASQEMLYKNKLPLLKPEGLLKENYKSLTTKMFLTFIDVYKKNGKDYDFFLKADDDAFIFMENLEDFLSESASGPEEETYFGYELQKFVSGGAGYVLTRGTLDRLASKLIVTNMTFCRNTGLEDVDLSTCLAKLNILPKSSLDFQNRERFHP